VANTNATRVQNIVVVSDIHAGCRLALCPPNGAALDDGGRYMPSAIQGKLHAIWREFWDTWVPTSTKGEPYAVVVNGDVIDGVHHNSTTQISHNLQDQAEIAYELLAPIVEKCEGRFYMIRGTEAHVGQSGTEEEGLAKRLDSVANENGQKSRYELWMKMGKGLIHFAHHIGTSGSMAYETTAVMKELTEMYADSARWSSKRPDCIVRSHRHRHIEVRVPTEIGYGIAFVTAAWQLRTPFSYRVAGGRVSQPQIGGSIIRQGDRDFFTEHFTRDIKRSEPVKV
jgi:hypothetical protein